VVGGKHPRGKTSTVVPVLGIDKSAAIYYRALTSYLAEDAGFQDARNATAQAATELYGADAAAAVHAAWTAVGVPGGPGGRWRRGCLRGHADKADFDLVLSKWNGNGWVQVAKSEGPSNLETVAAGGLGGRFGGVYADREGAVNRAGAGHFGVAELPPPHG
jgi:hypothetical protein